MNRPNIPLTSSVADNLLGVSWHDSTWIPILNSSNIMEYFCQASNPFYDRTCNNEIIKMQRLNPEHLQNMTGIEYVLLHIQEPILYVIRKQHRHASQQVTILQDYHIIAGTIYQAPDLASILNTRLLCAAFHLLNSFEEANSFARYHPSKGYFWDFKSTQKGVEKAKAAVEKEKPKEESSSLFQRQRVEMLLGELIKKFPIPQIPQSKIATPPQIRNENENGTQDCKEKIDKEKVKPPPEKKPRLG